MIRWLIILLVAWTSVGVGGWLVNDLSLFPEDDFALSTALPIAGLLCGILSGATLVACQRISFRAEPLLYRLLWGVLLFSGCVAIVMLGDRAYGMPYSIRRLIGGGRDLPLMLVFILYYVKLSAAILVGLWLAHPFFRFLRVGTLGSGPIRHDGTSTTSPTGLWSVVTNPWFSRMLVVFGLWCWFKAMSDIRQVSSTAEGLLPFIAVGLNLLCLLLTIPNYLSVTAKRRVLTVCGFSLLWLTFVGAGIGAPWGWLAFGANRDSLEFAIAISVGLLVSGFSLVQLLSLWSCCWFRDQSRRMFKGKTILSPAVEIANANNVGSAKNVDSEVSKQVSWWRRALTGIVLAAGLWSSIFFAILFASREVNLCAYFCSDADAWPRATLLAQLSAIDDTTRNRRVGARFDRYWWGNNPIVADNLGNLRAEISKQITEHPKWQALQAEIDRVFPQVFWNYTFPLQNVSDIRGTAFSNLVLDGEAIRLRDIPGTALAWNWTVIGGTIENADFARAANVSVVHFENCQFATDVDFNNVSRVGQHLHFRDCKFAKFPFKFEPNARMMFELSDPDLFLAHVPEFTKVLLQNPAARIYLPNTLDRDSQEFQDQIPEPWKQVLRLAKHPGDWYLDASSSEHLLAVQVPLPENLRTRMLQTDANGKLLGLSWRSASLYGTDPEVQPVLLGRPLNWAALSEYQAINSDEFLKAIELFKQSWLIQVGQVSNLREQLWIDQLAEIPVTPDGPQVLHLPGAFTATEIAKLKPAAWLRVLILEAQPVTNSAALDLQQMPQLEAVVILTAGDVPDANEQRMLKLFERSLTIPIHTLTSLDTPADLVDAARGYLETPRERP